MFWNERYRDIEGNTCPCVTLSQHEFFGYIAVSFRVNHQWLFVPDWLATENDRPV